MRIEDDELREIFAIASEERLANLETGVLALEENSGDRGPLVALLREAHSLKGDAGMLGVKDVQTLAHQFEHLLKGFEQGEQAATAGFFERLYRAIDALRRLVNEATTGEPANVDTFHLLAYLMGGPDPLAPAPNLETTDGEAPDGEDKAEVEVEPEPASGPALGQSAVEVPDLEAIAGPPIPEPELELELEPEPAPLNGTAPAPDPKPTPDATQDADKPAIAVTTADVAYGSAAPRSVTSPPTPTGDTPSPGTAAYRIDTIRVATAQLDHLMTQAGELTVAKIRIARRQTDLEELSDLCEEWSRDAFAHRLVINDVLRQPTEIRPGITGDRLQNRQRHSDRTVTLERLLDFHRRVEQRLERLNQIVDTLRGNSHEDTARLEVVADNLESGIRTLRLLPLSTIFNTFPRLVRDLARDQQKSVRLVIEGGDTKADKQILEAMKDPLLHALRNAIDHGIEPPAERERAGKAPEGTIWLRGHQTASTVILEIADDGRGLDTAAIRARAIERKLYTAEELDAMPPEQLHALVFSPGFSTRRFVTEVSGRGIGLDVLRANVEALKGTLEIDSTPGRGCTLRVRLSSTLATARVLLVAVAGVPFAIPVEAVETIRRAEPQDLFAVEGRDTMLVEGRSVSTLPLARLLEMDGGGGGALPKDRAWPCIVLRVGASRLGVLVDELIDEQDVVLKPQSRLFKRVRNIAGATILGSGDVCSILNPQDLIRSARQSGQAAMGRGFAPIAAGQRTPSDGKGNRLGGNEGPKRQTVLLVEDSIATRTQEKRVLEAAGYEVVPAVDGLDGYNKLATRQFDAVISDVQMPNLDGLELTERIRRHREYRDLPVILVTTLASDGDRQRGAEAGANAYITKGSFSQELLLETLRRFI
jgi:two-component system chemotaxis sensor kinase CheA